MFQLLPRSSGSCAFSCFHVKFLIEKSSGLISSFVCWSIKLFVFVSLKCLIVNMQWKNGYFFVARAVSERTGRCARWDNNLAVQTKNRCKCLFEVLKGLRRNLFEGKDANTGLKSRLFPFDNCPAFDALGFPGLLVKTFITRKWTI